jgi:hypothetical protein
MQEGDTDGGRFFEEDRHTKNEKRLVLIDLQKLSYFVANRKTWLCRIWGGGVKRSESTY